jgi:uncharacterized protein (DUF2141 family)
MKQTLSLYPLAFALLLAATGVHAEAARLDVRIKDVREATGNLRVSLYRDPETFRKEDRALKDRRSRRQGRVPAHFRWHRTGKIRADGLS